MFRMWGKVFADNHLLKDFVVENPSLDMTRTKKVFAALETSLMNLIWPSQSGCHQTFLILSVTPKHASLRTVLLRQLILTILKFRLLKKINSLLINFKIA